MTDIINIIRKNFQQTNKSGLGFLETNIVGCSEEISKRVEKNNLKYCDIQSIVLKHFQKVNREGVGFLESNIKNCIFELAKTTNNI